MTAVNDSRRKNLRAALGFLQLPPIEPELLMLHEWLDTWTGVGLITVGVDGRVTGWLSATSPRASGGHGSRWTR
ncbi:MAG TPA: hypothetical protein VFZ73_08810 [Gemmatimonadaceae bacterium]